MSLYYALVNDSTNPILIPQQFKQPKSRVFPMDLKFSGPDYVYFTFVSGKGFNFTYLGKLLCVKEHNGGYGQKNVKKLTFEYDKLFLSPSESESTTFVAIAKSPYQNKSLIEVLKMDPTIKFPQENQCTDTEPIESLNDIFKPKEPELIYAKYLNTGKIYVYDGINMGKLISKKNHTSNTLALKFEGSAGDIIVNENEKFYDDPAETERLIKAQREQVKQVMLQAPNFLPNIQSSAKKTILPSISLIDTLKSNVPKFPSIRGGRTKKYKNNNKKSKNTRKHKINKKRKTRKNVKHH